MAYGISSTTFGQPLEFPSLMSDEQVEEQFKVEEVELPRFQPIGVIRRHDPRLASELEPLWGYPGFTKMAERLAALKTPTGVSVLPPAVLGALLALARHHEANARDPGPISVWLVDATATRERSAT